MSGGAWKVAYADFVTAMMALFMVLWISAQEDEIVFKTVEYFKTPFGVGFNDGEGGGGAVGEGTGKEDMGDEMNINQQEQSKTSMVDLAFLHKMASDYYDKLNMKQNDGEKKAVKIRVSSDGLHITIFNQSNQPLFEKGTAQFTEWGKYMIQNLAWLIDRNNMLIRIGAHMPKGFTTDDPNYGPWELTVDRSNATRRLLESFVLKADKIFEISGYADTQPLTDTMANMPENQRLEISLLVD